MAIKPTTSRRQSSASRHEGSHPDSVSRSSLRDSTAREQRTIDQALSILESRLRARDVFSSRDSAKAFLRLQAQGLEHEVFAVMYLDSQNRLLHYAPLFRGTVSHVSVHPREIVKQALALNASAVILHHNHPGGTCTPSLADEAITEAVRTVMSLVDVQVLDHIVTSDEGAVSMADTQADQSSRVERLAPTVAATPVTNAATITGANSSHANFGSTSTM